MKTKELSFMQDKRESYEYVQDTITIDLANLDLMELDLVDFDCQLPVDFPYVPRMVLRSSVDHCHLYVIVIVQPVFQVVTLLIDRRMIVLIGYYPCVHVHLE